MIPLPIIWVLIGTILVTIEFVSMGATGLIAEAAGFAAFAIALVSLILPQIPIQVGLWLLLSTMAVWYSRKFVPKNSLLLMDAQEALTTSRIPTGKAGRVKFEGQSWRAVCQDPNLSIEEGVEVIVMEKSGTTLIVVPKNWLNPED